jgi:hypothetical protein
MSVVRLDDELMGLIRCSRALLFNHSIYKPVKLSLGLFLLLAERYNYVAKYCKNVVAFIRLLQIHIKFL